MNPLICAASVIGAGLAIDRCDWSWLSQGTADSCSCIARQEAEGKSVVLFFYH